MPKPDAVPLGVGFSFYEVDMAPLKDPGLLLLLVTAAAVSAFAVYLAI